MENHHALLGWVGDARVGEGVGGEDMSVSSSVAGVGTLLVVVVGVDVDGSEEGGGVLVAARRDFSSLFSFLVSVRVFSIESMCILNSTFSEDSLAIFCIRSWFSVINPFVLSSKSVMYSFLRCLERAADCLFFNSLQGV